VESDHEPKSCIANESASVMPRSVNLPHPAFVDCIRMLGLNLLLQNLELRFTIVELSLSELFIVGFRSDVISELVELLVSLLLKVLKFELGAA